MRRAAFGHDLNQVGCNDLRGPVCRKQLRAGPRQYRLDRPTVIRGQDGRVLLRRQAELTGTTMVDVWSTLTDEQRQRIETGNVTYRQSRAVKRWSDGMRSRSGSMRYSVPRWLGRTAIARTPKRTSKRGAIWSSMPRNIRKWTKASAATASGSSLIGMSCSLGGSSSRSIRG